jgi:ATP-dependent Lhr-like helicase
LFTGVRAIIIDELHFLHGTARGQQARAVIHRIQQRAVRPNDPRDNFQRVGLTATLDDPDRVAQLWLGDLGTSISVGSARDIELKYLDARIIGVGRSISEAVVQSDCRKILVFSNKRNAAHALASELSNRLQAEGWAVYLHIGIMAAGEREQVEAAIRRDGRALCVATSTLELGIDIGDIDAVVLAEPPNTINAFLQRIGRGNRRSDKCQVWAVVEDTAQQNLYRALHHCSTRGFLDDAYEYQRHAVEFQQAMSFAWEWSRRDKPLTREVLTAMLGDHVRAEGLDDMVASGVLQQIGSALVPSQHWMDEGNQRRIHTVLAAPAGVPIIDLHSGETVGTAQRNSQATGRLFTGTRTREIKASDESGFYLSSSKHSHGALATLPIGRRGTRGHPRRLVWALAELDGFDPHIWRYNQGTLTTWGGGDFNNLVKESLVALGYAQALTADSFSISGFSSLPVGTPSDFVPLEGVPSVVEGR